MMHRCNTITRRKSLHNANSNSSSSSNHIWPPSFRWIYCGYESYHYCCRFLIMRFVERNNHRQCLFQNNFNYGQSFSSLSFKFECVVMLLCHCYDNMILDWGSRTRRIESRFWVILVITSFICRPLSPRSSRIRGVKKIMWRQFFYDYINTVYVDANRYLNH